MSASIKKKTAKKAKNKSAKRPVIALVDRGGQKRSKRVAGVPEKSSKASKNRALKGRKEGKRRSSTDERIANLTSHDSVTRLLESLELIKSDLAGSLTQTQAGVDDSSEEKPAVSAMPDKSSRQSVSFASPWLWNMEAINTVFRVQSSMLQSLSRFSPVTAALNHQVACYSMMVDALTALNRREPKRW